MKDLGTLWVVNDDIPIPKRNVLLPSKNKYSLSRFVTDCTGEGVPGTHPQWSPFVFLDLIFGPSLNEDWKMCLIRYSFSAIHTERGLLKF